jgi:type IV pilus assembly protein PilC
MFPFRSGLDLQDLVELCRAMRFAISSGLMLRDVMDLLARDGTPKIKPVAAAIAKELRAGWSLEEAMQKQGSTLPQLFVSLATVGEASGNLPEVLHELERYYKFQQKLQQEFNEQIGGPMLQFTAAVLVVTLLIYVLGIIPVAQGQERLDPLGMGLIGTRGAIIFFLSVTGGLLGLMLAYLGLKQLFGRFAFVERALLAIPALGTWLRASAISRLCLAGRLMLDTSLSVFKTIRLSFLATNNQAYIAALPEIESSLQKGNSISESFRQANLFPAKFISGVTVGEESGRLPETLRHQGEEYEEEARQNLTWLTRLVGWVIWIAIVAFIIFCIYSIFTSTYMKSINSAFDRSGGLKS